MIKITKEYAKKALNIITELEEVIGPLYVALEWPDFQIFLYDENVAFDEEGDFLLVPVKQYINKISKQ